MDIAVINLLWYPQAQFAGYLLAEHLGLGNDAGVQIRTTPVDFARGPALSLLEGASDFAVASPAHILHSPDPRALRLLLTMQQASPLVYPVRRSSGIRELRHLAGERVAVWPGGEDLELRWMLRRAGVDPDAVERVPVADTVAAFVRGEVAGTQATVYHELHLLERAGFPAGKLHVFNPEDHGAALLKDGLVTSARLIEERPELVQAVVDAVLEGWRYAFARPHEAVDMCLLFRPELEGDEQAAQLGDIRALTFANAALEHGVGYPDPRHMERTAAALAELGEAAPGVDAGALIEARFWHAAPEAGKAILGGLGPGGAAGSGPKGSGPQRSGPQRPGPKRSRSKRSGPQRSGPQRSGPQRSGPQRSGSPRSGPQRSGPKRSGPKRSGPKRSGPKRSGPKRSGCKRSTSKGPGLEGSGRGGPNR